MSTNSFDARSTLSVGAQSYEFFRLDALAPRHDIARLPFSLKVLLENLLRCEDGESIRAADVEALASWNAAEEPNREIAFTPAPRPDAGLHRRPRRRRPRCDARCDARDGGRPEQDQSAPSPPSSSSTIRSRSTSSGPHLPSRATPSSSSAATASGTRSCVGARTRSTTSRSSRRTPGSSIRSTSSTSPASCSSSRRERQRRRPTRTRSSAPTRTRP